MTLQPMCIIERLYSPNLQSIKYEMLLQKTGSEHIGGLIAYEQ